MKRLLDSTLFRRLAHALPSGVRTALAAALQGNSGWNPAAEALVRDARRRLCADAVRHEAKWRKVRTVQDWERLRSNRVAALRRSLEGTRPRLVELAPRVTGRIENDRFRIEKLVFRSRPEFWVTANLYRPTDVREPRPGIVICHSHHTGKHHPELQELGSLWASAGCTVLVADLLGHGERRQHPFRSAGDYRLPYKVDRQDYYFRYNLGLQLQLAGESLTGWLTWDLMRAIDVIVELPEVDAARVLLIGSVAGGGDLAAVTAALDARVAGLVAFGFRREDIRVGDGERQATIPGAGEGSWESTRSLQHSSRDGFLPWVILAACAPRHLVYAHEFAWNPGEDRAWQRLRRVYRLYGVEERLAAIHGSGDVTGPPPHNTHCTHVGSLHRRQLDPLLQRWFGIHLPDEATTTRHSEAQLACFPDSDLTHLGSLPVHRLLFNAVRRTESAADPAIERKRWVDGLRLLAQTEPSPEAQVHVQGRTRCLGHRAELARFDIAEGVACELLLLFPEKRAAAAPVVIGLAQQGRRALARARSRLIRALLREGAAVCLFDSRGVGNAQRGPNRGRHDPLVGVAAAERMLGGTLLGARIADVRTALRYLATRLEIDTGRVAVWGDSLTRANPRDFDPAVPYDAGPFPDESEPLGGLLALCVALIEPQIRAVYVRRSLSAWRSVLESPFCYLSYDAVLPGILRLGDLPDAAAALAPLPVWLESLVDGHNREVPVDDLERMYRSAREAYDRAGFSERLRLRCELSDAHEIGEWLVHWAVAS